MKKFSVIFLTVLFIFFLNGCKAKTELHAEDPVTLSMWHVYGEQADSPMNRLVDEFNITKGKDVGIVVNVTSMSNSVKVGKKLLESQSNAPGSPEMPDLFFCHTDNAVALGVDNLVDWSEHFTKDSLNDYVPEFLNDGRVEEKLVVFPVSKSTHLLYVAGGQFERFSAACGYTYDDLADWDSFFEVAEAYYKWSGGKAFCAIDYLLRCVELDAMSFGANDIFSANGWYDANNPYLKKSWDRFARSIAKGHIILSDMFSNTQVMTGDVVCGLGSSASILYYNDVVTYSDNTQEPINLKVLPLPLSGGEKNYITQAGVGLCSYKTTSQKAEAAAVFAKWLTEKQRNLEFATETGYMPVNLQAFNEIDAYNFKNDVYKNLYNVYSKIRVERTSVPEMTHPEFYSRQEQFYSKLRSAQKTMKFRYESGEDEGALADELWDALCKTE